MTALEVLDLGSGAEGPDGSLRTQLHVGPDPGGVTWSAVWEDGHNGTGRRGPKDEVIVWALSVPADAKWVMPTEVSEYEPLTASFLKPP